MFSAMHSWFVGVCVKCVPFVYQCNSILGLFGLFQLAFERVDRIPGFQILRQAIPPSFCSWQERVIVVQTRSCLQCLTITRVRRL